MKAGGMCPTGMVSCMKSICSLCKGLNAIVTKVKKEKRNGHKNPSHMTKVSTFPETIFMDSR